MTYRNHEGDIIDRDFPAAVTQVKVDLVDFVGDLPGLRSGSLDEELKSLSLNGESFLAGDSLDDASDLFFPAFLGDVDLIERLVARIFLRPFPKAPDSIDSSGT